MAYANEHSARQASPDGFARFARSKPQGWPQGVDAIFGVDAAGKSSLQSVHFDKSKWTPAKASKWLEEHKLKPAVEEARADANDLDSGDRVSVYADGACARFDDADEAQAGAEVVQRYDTTELAAPVRTKAGFLRAQGFITRAGVFSYAEGGATRREFRPPEAVFAPDSLKSFDLAPVTLGHPTDASGQRVNVTPQTARALAVGSVGAPTRVGDHVRADVLITDATAIAEVEAGRSKLSCGYSCRLLPKAGVYVRADGVEEPFDLVQVQIDGNHLALAHHARAGDAAGLRMDETGDVRADSIWTASYQNDLPDSAFLFVEPGGALDKAGKTVPRTLRHFPVRNAEGEVDLAHVRDALGRIPQSDVPETAKAHATAAAQKLLEAQKADSPEGEPTVKIKIEGVEHDLPEAAAQYIAKLQAVEGTIVALRADSDAKAGKLAALEADAAKRALDAAKSGDEAKIRARVELSAKGAAILGKPLAEVVRMDEAEIIAAVVKKEAPTLDLTGKSAEYVRAIFDHVTANRVDTTAALNAIVGDVRRADAVGAGGDPFKKLEEARQKMLTGQANAWQASAAK